MAEVSQRSQPNTSCEAVRGRSPAPRLLGRALRSSQLAETESSSPPASGPQDKGRPVVSVSVGTP